MPLIAGQIDDVGAVQHGDPDGLPGQRGRLLTEPVELLDLIQPAQVRRAELNQFAAQGEFGALPADQPGLFQGQQQVGR